MTNDDAPVAPGDAPPPNLVYRGGRTLQHLTYKVLYYGPAWRQTPDSLTRNPHADARDRIDCAIQLAMNDRQLNQLLSQYFGGKDVSAQALASEIIDDDPRPSGSNVPFNERDIRRIIGNLAQSKLAGLDFATTAINIVLPQGMSLEILGLDEQERPAGTDVMHGVPRDTPNYSSSIAGYHGSVVLDPAAGSEVLYSVVAWSDGSIGIPVPGWEGWENITAILYHELQEIRTNPDVDRAVRTGVSSHVGWNTDPIEGPDEVDCREIADLPLILYGEDLHRAFTRITAERADGSKEQVPVQALWSNDHGQILPVIA